MMEKEIPFEMIPECDRELHRAAEEKELARLQELRGLVLSRIGKLRKTNHKDSSRADTCSGINMPGGRTARETFP